MSQIEATVTESGWGSSISVNGVELSEVKSFQMTAELGGSSVVVELAASSKIVGSVQHVKCTGTVFVLLNENNEPIKVVCDREAMKRDIRSRSAEGFIEVPVEVDL